MHDSMPCDLIQGQGHECLKATEEESTVSHFKIYIVVKLENC